MLSQPNSRRYHGEDLERAGEMITRVRYERGEDPLDVLCHLADAPDATIAAANDAICNVSCERVGIAAREYVLGPLPAGQSRRRAARHQKRLQTAGFSSDAVARFLDDLCINAPRLALTDLPSILLTAAALESGQDLDRLALDTFIAEGQRIDVRTLLTTTAASITAQTRGGERVISASIAVARDSFSGLTAQITTRCDTEPASVRHVIAARDVAKQSSEFQANHAGEIARFSAVCRDLRRGRATVDDLFAAAWSLERALDRWTFPVPARVRTILGERAERTAMMARFDDVLTERACGIAIPNVVLWGEAAMALAAVTDSSREAQACFEAARQVAAAFLEAEQEPISRLALELAPHTELTEQDITRVLGT